MLSKKSNLFYFSVLILVFISGLIAGFIITGYEPPLNWNGELKAGDIFAVLASIVTFVFAYKGLKDNRKHFELSNKPIIRILRIAEFPDGLIQISLNNIGNGLASTVKCRIYLDGVELTVSDVNNELISRCCPKTFIRSRDIKYLKPTEQIVLFSIDASQSPEKTSIIDDCGEYLTERLNYVVEYEDVFKNTYQESYSFNNL